MTPGFIVYIWSWKEIKIGCFLSLVVTFEPFQVKRHSVIIFLGGKWGKLGRSRKRGKREISLATDDVNFYNFYNFFVYFML